MRDKSSPSPAPKTLSSGPSSSPPAFLHLIVLPQPESIEIALNIEQFAHFTSGCVYVCARALSDYKHHSTSDIELGKREETRSGSPARRGVSIMNGPRLGGSWRQSLLDLGRRLRDPAPAWAPSDRSPSGCAFPQGAGRLQEQRNEPTPSQLLDYVPGTQNLGVLYPNSPEPVPQACRNSALSSLP